MTTEDPLTEPATAIARARSAAASVAASTPAERAVKALLEAHLEQSLELAELSRRLQRHKRWAAYSWHLEVQHYTTLESARNALSGVTPARQAGLVDIATGEAWARQRDLPWVAAVAGSQTHLGVKPGGDLADLAETPAAKRRR